MENAQPKRYRLLTQKGYDPKEFKAGEKYDGSYHPNKSIPVFHLVRAFPRDWEFVNDGAPSEPKKYKLLNDSYIFLEKGRMYDENYMPMGSAAIKEYVAAFPEDWGEVEDIGIEVSASLAAKEQPKKCHKGELVRLQAENKELRAQLQVYENLMPQIISELDDIKAQQGENAPAYFLILRISDNSLYSEANNGYSAIYKTHEKAVDVAQQFVNGAFQIIPVNA